MAATFNYYHNFKLKLMKGDIDFNTHTFKCVLLTSAYTPSASTHDEYVDLTNELATANGYTITGQALSTTALTLTAGTIKFDADDIYWTATPGDIGPARYLVIYDDTVTGDPLIAYVDFGEDKTAGVGTDFKVNWHANGIITLG